MCQLVYSCACDTWYRLYYFIGACWLMHMAPRWHATVFGLSRSDDKVLLTFRSRLMGACTATYTMTFTVICTPGLLCDSLTHAWLAPTAITFLHVAGDSTQPVYLREGSSPSLPACACVQRQDACPRLMMLDQIL